MSEVMKHKNVNEKSDRQKEAENDLVFSYLTLRNRIGIRGLLLPLILVLPTSRGANDRFIEPSISDYYYSSNGDVLVVLLSVLGVFLFTYTGYKWQESVLTTLAAISGIGVAFSPTATQSANSFSIHTIRNEVPTVFGLERHFLFAASFFIALAIVSLKYFPRTDKMFLQTELGTMTQKAKRNWVYKICGWIIVVCVIVLGIHFIIRPDALTEFPVVFVFETIAVEAFGIAWITKGQTLWPDGRHYMARAFQKLKESF